VSLIDFGKIALADHIAKVEDVILYLLAGDFLVGTNLAHN
jgi:hypothetical protein